MKYRNQLPQSNGVPCLTDGGLETVMIFENGIDLPDFAAFTLLDHEGGEGVLVEYFHPYAAVAQKFGMGLQLDSPTWRANPDWGDGLGYAGKRLDEINRRAIALMEEVRGQHECPGSPMPISGSIGPRGDGYVATAKMDAMEAERYHARQIGVFADSEADLVTAYTLNYEDEAVGIIRAAEKAGIPVGISFTVETDGRLPGGRSLGEAIAHCDAATDGFADYFMVNCAHPNHIVPSLGDGGEWTARLRGIRANASKMSHTELDEAEELDSGNPVELGADFLQLVESVGGLTLFGGCCGTDHRHVEAIARSISASLV